MKKLRKSKKMWKKKGKHDFLSITRQVTQALCAAAVGQGGTKRNQVPSELLLYSPTWSSLACGGRQQHVLPAFSSSHLRMKTRKKNALYLHFKGIVQSLACGLNQKDIAVVNIRFSRKVLLYLLASFKKSKFIMLNAQILFPINTLYS